MSVIAINYADDKFESARQYNTKTALKKGHVDRVIEYSIRDLDESFKIRNKNILAKKKGAGCMIWKPYIIVKALEEIENGDYLVYCDSGAVYLKNMNILIEFINKTNQDILFFGPHGTSKEWTKRDIFVALDADTDKYHNSEMNMSGFLIIRNSPNTRTIMQEWLDCCQVDTIITDEENKLGKENYKEFIANRHDQSILNIVRVRHDYPLFRDPSQWGFDNKISNEMNHWIKSKTLKRKELDFPKVIFCHRKAYFNNRIFISVLLEYYFPFAYKVIIGIKSLLKTNG